ncbi:MAG: hypothetical protein K9M98_02850 [Cephaloticoccus sp.]|nr:hypothetical protein [Cephaloticoccus sp.]MCF7759419.1 hypothetical protein [Cephaloticoccus sp.]
MSKIPLQILGWTVAHTPEFVLRPIAWLLGALVFGVRRRSLLANLSHAFPERDPRDLHKVAHESARRLVETGLLSLAMPYLSDARLRVIVSASPNLLAFVARQQTNPEPTVLAAAHMAYWEAQPCTPLVVPAPFPEMGAIFRPIDNPAVNAWVKQCRERFGIRLLSRKDGFQEALKILRRRGIIGVLFDQNAGHQGALATLFGRVCSSTELPGLLTQKFSANLYAYYPERHGFWRAEITVEEISNDGTTAGVTLALNRWLELKLSNSANFCASWLWAHARWKNQDIPAKRLRLEAKRNLLTEDLAARQLTELPRRTRFWIRAPNWLGDVVMMLPLLRAIRASRPDAEITLIAKPGFLPLLNEVGAADRLVALPAQGWGYFAHFWRLRMAFPDCYILFTNSFRGDLEAWLTRTPQRFGIIRPGKWRPLLTHNFRVAENYAEGKHHQLELWTQFLQHFGLAAQPNVAPVADLTAPRDFTIGLIAGSENNPEKRWPVAHWCTLIGLLPTATRVVLFGTISDRAITDEITARCQRPVENQAGRTTMSEYMEQLRLCTVLVTNDTGGMHLANALGVPLIALFGPTNPIRTGPVFSAPVTILQPAACAPTGGGNLADLTPAQVILVLHELCPSALP